MVTIITLVWRQKQWKSQKQINSLEGKPCCSDTQATWTIEVTKSKEHLEKLPREEKKVKSQGTGFCTRLLRKKTSRVLLQQRPSPARWGTEGSYLSKVSRACKNQCGLNCPKKEKENKHSVSPHWVTLSPLAWRSLHHKSCPFGSHPLTLALEMDRQKDTNIRGLTTTSKYGRKKQFKVE